MLRRHDLVFVSPAAWQSATAPPAGAARDALVAGWVDRGWPLIVRRVTPGDRPGVPLGLPLPPAHGKRRLAFVLPPSAILSTRRPPLLEDAIAVAPRAWRSTMRQLACLAHDHGIEARVYGSIAWTLLTGLDYLTAKSDLDLLLSLPRRAAAFTAALAALERTAPMRFDGELVRDDGAAVNWREVHAGAGEVLVKTTRDAVLLSTYRFIGAEALP